jgi:hypothetical protein
METVNDISAVTAPRRPWNKGKLIGPKPPLHRGCRHTAMLAENGSWNRLAITRTNPLYGFR